jgi:hypothetical protein
MRMSVCVTRRGRRSPEGRRPNLQIRSSLESFTFLGLEQTMQAAPVVNESKRKGAPRADEEVRARMTLCCRLKSSRPFEPAPRHRAFASQGRSCAACYGEIATVERFADEEPRFRVGVPVAQCELPSATQGTQHVSACKLWKWWMTVRIHVHGESRRSLWLGLTT